MIHNFSYGTGGSSGLLPQIWVYSDTGSVVTCDGIIGSETSGKWIFDVTLGNHTLTSTKDGVTKTKVYNVEKVGINETSISLIEWIDNFDTFDTSKWEEFGTVTKTVSNNKLSVVTEAYATGGIQTVQTITGSERSIEATFILTAETGTYYENYQSIGLRTKDSDADALARVCRSSYSSPYYRMMSMTQSQYLSPSGYDSYPQERKIVADIINNKFMYYFNGELICTLNDTITLSNYIGKPYISIAGGMWFAQSQTLSSISLKVN